MNVVLARCGTDPPAPWDDVSHCLRQRYSAEVSVLASGHLTSPLTMLAAIVKRLNRASAGALLVVTGVVQRFARQHGDLWALALPDSIPGRPGSMLRLDRLIETATRATGGRPLLISLDATVFPGGIDGQQPSIMDFISQFITACQKNYSPTPSMLIRSIEHRASSIEHRASSIEHRASSIEHLLDRLLAARAAAGRPTSLAEIATEISVLGHDDGSSIVAFPSSDNTGLMRPVVCGPVLPEHIHADLFAWDDGSRLDAAVELARLADDGNVSARYELQDLVHRDRSSQVRDYANLLARRSAQPALARLLWQGRVPRHVYDTARYEPFLPEFRWQPGGSAPIGIDNADPVEAPRHIVDLTPFRLSRTPITDREYLTFLVSEGGPCPDHWATQTDLWDPEVNRPVVMVSYHDARRYCAWLDRLLHEKDILGEEEHVLVPSEVEWESAASDGQGHHYPWGDQPDPMRANIRATGLGRPSSVGRFSPGGDNTAGCVDLVGNVWEWTRSIWGHSYRIPSYGYPYDAADGRERPDLPGIRHVVRGGAFYYATDCANSSTRNRVVADERHPGGGFRVAITKQVPT